MGEPRIAGRRDLTKVHEIASANGALVGGAMRQIGTPDSIQGKVLAALPWEGGRKTEAVARHAFLDEDTVRRALEDLVRRGMVTIDDRSYWRKKPLD